MRLAVLCVSSLMLGRCVSDRTLCIGDGGIHKLEGVMNCSVWAFWSFDVANKDEEPNGGY